MRRRTAAKREAILDAALHAFSALGFAGASISDISARLGGSRQTIYSYFPSKTALFRALISERATTQLTPLLERLRHEADLEKGLCDLARDYLVFVTSREALGLRRLIVAEGHKGGLGVAFFEAGPAPFLNHLSSVLEMRLAREGCSALTPDWTALLLIALIEAGPYQRLLTGALEGLAAEEMERHVADAVRTFLRAAL